jgi:sulfide:quinone oxidoreductase
MPPLPVWSPTVKHVVILGAGFAGLELATRLSESLAGDVRTTLIDQNPSFSFGFSKLDVLFGRKTAADVRLHYDKISKEGVDFRQERVTSVDPEQKHVTTDAGSYDADILVVALGADYDFAATPGFAEHGVEYYSVAGAERMRDAVSGFDAGRILIGILGHPFKCPPAPFEGALLLHDHFLDRGTRDSVEICTVGPISAPVPIVDEVSQTILGALTDRGIEFVPNEQIVEIRESEAQLASGGRLPFDLFVGVPVHRAPTVLESGGLAVNGWVPVERTNLATRFPDVYAVGDVTALQMAKAGVFAEAAARVVADDIAARFRDDVVVQPFEGKGTCYLEFGGGLVGKVEANFFGGPTRTARLVGPSEELAADKREFAKTRQERWFGT